LEEVESFAIPELSPSSSVICASLAFIFTSAEQSFYSNGLEICDEMTEQISKNIQLQVFFLLGTFLAIVITEITKKPPGTLGSA
jgi:hypothetical protein